LANKITDKHLHYDTQRRAVSPQQLSFLHWQENSPMPHN